MTSNTEHHPSEGKSSDDGRLNLRQIDIIKPDPKTGITTLPEWMDNPDDDGLYGDF